MKAKIKDIREFIDFVENIPDLKWADSENCEDIEDIFYEECFSTTPFGEYNVRYFYYDKAFSLYFNDEKLLDNFQNLDDIKKEANNDYKNKIKSALGL